MPTLLQLLLLLTKTAAHVGFSRRELSAAGIRTLQMFRMTDPYVLVGMSRVKPQALMFLNDLGSPLQRMTKQARSHCYASQSDLTLTTTYLRKAHVQSTASEAASVASTQDIRRVTSSRRQMWQIPYSTFFAAATR
jgi:hypothetical protein